MISIHVSSFVKNATLTDFLLDGRMSSSPEIELLDRLGHVRDVTHEIAGPVKIVELVITFKSRGHFRVVSDDMFVCTLFGKNEIAVLNVQMPFVSTRFCRLECKEDMIIHVRYLGDGHNMSLVIFQ